MQIVISPPGGITRKRSANNIETVQKNRSKDEDISMGNAKNIALSLEGPLVQHPAHKQVCTGQGAPLLSGKVQRGSRTQLK